MALDPLGVGWRPLVESACDALTGAGANPPRGHGRSAFSDGVGAYLDELVAWNRKIDLTAARTPEELVDLTIADAWVVASSSAEAGVWIDVGSGAGAPGLVIAMLLRDVTMTLVEPKDKRVAFLRSTAAKLRLSNVRVERSTSSRLPEGSCDSAVSRATLPPAEWLREGKRLSRKWVWLLLAGDAPPDCPGLSLEHDLRYTLPLTGATRRAARYTRTAK